MRSSEVIHGWKYSVDSANPRLNKVIISNLTVEARGTRARTTIPGYILNAAPANASPPPEPIKNTKSFSFTSPALTDLSSAIGIAAEPV